MKNERLYRYQCETEGKIVTGTTWNTCKENVINDVKSNYVEAKKIIVVWLKRGTMDFIIETQIKGEM